MIRFSNIYHQVGDKTLFNDLSWHINPHEHIGLVGNNGTGKTTLLRMIAGEVSPQTGNIYLHKNITIGWLQQEQRLETMGLSAIDYVMLAFEKELLAEKKVNELYHQLTISITEEQDGILAEIHHLETHLLYHDKAIAEAEAYKILLGLGFSQEMIPQPLATLSGGWQMRAYIAKLLLEQPDILMLDEPTNHLDLPTIQWMEGFLTNYRGCLVIVSHDLYFLDKLTQYTALLAENRIKIYKGNYTESLKLIKQDEESLIKSYADQQKQIEHIEKFIERFRYKATKAAAVQSRVKQLEKLQRIELPQSSRKTVSLRIPTPISSPTRMLELRGVSKSYGTNNVFSNINLIIDKHDKVGFIGKNGAGKSTLLKIIAGQIDFSGKRFIDPKTRIGYFSQNSVDTLNFESDVITEARPLGATYTEAQMRTVLGCFLFSGDDVFKKVKVLSGGEKARVALAKLLLTPLNLLLFDEPTNHLDMATREILRDALHNYVGTLVLISHDRHFLKGIVNRVVDFSKQTITQYLGTLPEYLAKVSEETAKQESIIEEKTPVPKVTVAEMTVKNKHELLKLKSAIRQQIKECEEEIDRTESRIKEIHSLQSEANAWVDERITPGICAEAKQLESYLPMLMSKWEELQDKLYNFSS